MLWVKLSTHVVDHQRFLEAGAAARDLWAWGMLYSGKHETDGDLPMAAVLASAWGAGPRGNIKPAMKLVEVGLWERTDSGFKISRWAEQGNETKASLTEKREAAKTRKSRSGSRELSANEHRTNVKGSTSTSLSSGSLLGSQIASAQVDRTEPLADDARSVFDRIAMNRHVGQTPEVAWTNFTGHFADQVFASRGAIMGRWQKWVNQQCVYGEEAREKDRQREAAAEERRRFNREGPEKPPPPTKEQSLAFARELAARVTAGRKVGT